jgi:hypothetical protein
MDHPEGAGKTGDGRLGFDRRVRLKFRGTQLSSDGGLLVMRELDDVLGLSDLASGALNNNRRGKKTVHRLGGIFRQSVYGRLAGYEDVNDADRLALDPVIIRSCARLVLSRLRSGLSTHLCGLSFECQGAFATQR